MDMRLSRRSVLHAGLGIAAGAALGGSLTACGDGGAGVLPPAAGRTVLPDYVPYTAVTPDFPGTEQGVLNGFYHYPATPVRAFPDGPPAEGDPFRFMTIIYNPVPPPVSRNRLWQELNAYLGADLQLEIVPSTDYVTKFSLTIAGGDLPDGMLVRPEAPQKPGLLSALCEDLTPYLSGSAVRRYPYLANLPTMSWRNCVLNGRIYGVPMPRLNSGSAMFYRADFLAARSLNPEPANFAEFLQLCRDLTDPSQTRYACGDPLTTFYFVMEMLGSPKDWREENGRFTWYLEDTDRVRQGLDAMRQLVRAGVMHPDGFSTTGRFKDWFGNGQIAINYDGATAWNDYYRSYRSASPDLRVGAMVAPGFDGGPGVHWAGPSSFSMFSLKKAAPARIEQLLRALDALATPFGTDGYLLRKFGVPGHDFDFRESDPILNRTGTTENTLPAMFATDAPQVLYYPDDPSVVPEQYAWQQKAVSVLISDAAEGLYSAADAARGGPNRDLMFQTLRSYMQERNTWDDVLAGINRWRTVVGDQSRVEYEQAWQQWAV
ncbi:extracellular solute-binding protein [Pseudonocardia aurantiaca]|uniref:ABC transporter substrate-binding protein n=1 Tax=Pseudonocardia aurantiaca TaxID=75290 RepID=A0ABW4FSR1_9PSEU